MSRLWIYLQMLESTLAFCKLEESNQEESTFISERTAKKKMKKIKMIIHILIEVANFHHRCIPFNNSMLHLGMDLLLIIILIFITKVLKIKVWMTQKYLPNYLKLQFLEITCKKCHSWEKHLQVIRKIWTNLFRNSELKTQHSQAEYKIWNQE